MRILIVLTIGVGLGLGAFATGHVREDGESVKVIAARDIKEKLDGKEATATVVEVTIEPGQAGVPHRHPGSSRPEMRPQRRHTWRQSSAGTAVDQ